MRFTAESECSARRSGLPFAVWLAGLGLLGVCLTATGMLVLQHFEALRIPGCGPTSDCARAVASRWGRIGWWPASFVGLAYFAAVAAVWLKGECTSLVRYLVRLGAVVSVGYVAILVREQHYCVYCLATHAAHLPFWLLLEATKWPSSQTRPAGLHVGSRGTAHSGWSAAAWRPAVRFGVVFAVGLAMLNVLESERKWSAAERAEEQIKESIEKISAATPSAGDGSNRGAVPPAPESAAASLPSGDASTQTATAEGVTAWKTALAAEEPQWRRLGPEQAPVHLVLFYDYQCEHCFRLERNVQTLFKQYAEVMSVTVRHYPLCTDCNYLLKTNTHPNACRAALAAEAAGMLKGGDGFWRMHSWLFEQKGTFTDAELKSGLGELGFESPELFLETMHGQTALRRVLDDIIDAEALQVDGTPTIFINRVELQGWQAEGALARAVAAAADRSVTKGRATPSSAAAEKASASGEFAKRIQEAAVLATVGVVNLQNGSEGSGVVVGLNGPFVYVLTAKHVVREAADLEVHSFSSGTDPVLESTYRAVEVVARTNDDEDLALLRMPAAGRTPEPIPICPPHLVPAEAGFAALSVGCNAGQAPTCLAAPVLDKRLVRKRAGGAAVLIWETTDGDPSAGRSGGPLIDQRGYLIGLRSGSDGGKAYYCHPEQIHRLLRHAGMEWLYERTVP